MVSLMNEHITTKPFQAKSKRYMLYVNPFDSMCFELETVQDCAFCAKPKVPLCSEQIESAVIPTPPSQVWCHLKSLELHILFPNIYKNVSKLENGSYSLVF